MTFTFDKTMDVVDLITRFRDERFGIAVPAVATAEAWRPPQRRQYVSNRIGAQYSSTNVPLASIGGKVDSNDLQQQPRRLVSRSVCSSWTP